MLQKLCNGVYTVSIDQNGAGVELHLVLDEENGTIAPTEVGTIGNTAPTVNLWWLWLLLALVAICAVALVIYCRKKAK